MIGFSEIDLGGKCGRPWLSWANILQPCLYLHLIPTTAKKDYMLSLLQYIPLIHYSVFLNLTTVVLGPNNNLLEYPTNEDVDEPDKV